jgi:hypothetical protein
VSSTNFQIPANGNCLYLSVIDQINSSSDVPYLTTQLKLRKIVSDHIREHKDDYIPFLETELEVYLEKLDRGLLGAVMLRYWR